MTTKTKRVPKHIQAEVDKYIELDALVKKYTAELKEMRKEIEPYMHAHGVSVIKGSLRGSISLKPRDMAITTARYSSYDVDGVVSLLDNKAKKEAIVQVVDKEVLELLVKTGKAPAEVNNYRVTKPSMAFSISHK